MAIATLELKGNKTEAFGADPSNLKTYDFIYKVVPIDQLVVSHTDTFELNPKYPQELQPRIRDRTASRTQITTMAQNLNPAVLIRDSGFLDTGPMIVGPDNVVESGNGRTLALRKAALDNSERYQAYKIMLIKLADKYGLNPDAIVKMDNPVLVRERLTDVPRAQFAAEANTGSIMRMSPYEQALQDSSRLSDNIIGSLVVGEDQSIDQALKAKTNNHIIVHFANTVPANERATISEAGGSVNQQGLQRLKLAIFAKTYTGNAGQRLTRIFGENVDPIIKNLENALFQSLPEMAKAESLIRSGHREKDLSISDDLAEAVDTYAAMKQSGVSIKDYLAQSAMFEERLTPFQRQILEHLDTISRSPKQSREFVRSVAEKIVDAPPKGQVSMLGSPAPSIKELVNAIINKQRTEQNLPGVPVAASAAAHKELEKPNSGGNSGASGMGKDASENMAEIDRTRQGQELGGVGTSVQVGLSGFGKDEAQVEMFGEFGGAGGGGTKEKLIDDEKEKAKEKAKPLEGQIEAFPEKPPEKLPEKPPTKKEWEMTAEELVNSRKNSPFPIDWMEVKFLHKAIIREALAEGKPVPLEVLKEYPELMKPEKAPDPRPGPEPVKKPEKPNDLSTINELRTVRSKVADKARLNSKVIAMDDKRIEKWKKDPGIYDVAGIDTPSGAKVNYPRKNITPSDYGKEAFAKGIHAAAQDKDFLDKFIAGRKIGDKTGSNALDEWNKGWQKAHKEASDQDYANKTGEAWNGKQPVKTEPAARIRAKTPKFKRPSGSAGGPGNEPKKAKASSNERFGPYFKRGGRLSRRPC